MTQYEIIQMANEAGLNSYRIAPAEAVAVWERFAALVEAKAAAKVRVDHSVDANKMAAAPEEWQLVPVEPTEDMRLAMATHGVKHLEWAGDVYAAALAAAPKP